MFGFCCSPVAVDRILPEIGNSNVACHKSILKKQRTHGEFQRVRSFRMIRIRISDAAASALGRDSSVPLMRDDPSYLKSLVLMRGWPRATSFPALDPVVCLFSPLSARTTGCVFYFPAPSAHTTIFYFPALSALTTGCALYFPALFPVSTSASNFS